jgi:hypothetical protein
MIAVIDHPPVTGEVHPCQPVGQTDRGREIMGADLVFVC